MLRRMAEPRSVARQRIISSFWIRIAVGEQARIFSTSSTAAAARRAADVTRLTRPHSKACSALTLSPVRRLLTGESVSAEQAFEWGLVNRVTSAARLAAAAVELVEKILACSPTAIRIQKELMIRWRATDLGSAIRLSINAFAQNYASTEAREAALAFLEKRKAVFPPRS